MKYVLYTLLLFSTSNLVHARTIILNEQNTVVIGAPIRPAYVASVSSELLKKYIAAPSSPLYVVIYTNGGMLIGVKELRDQMNSYKNVRIIIMEAFSAGAYLSQLKSSPILITNMGRIGFHEVTTEVSGRLSAKEFMREAISFQIETTKWNKGMCHRLKCGYDKYVEKITNKTWFLYAQDAIKQNAATNIVTVECDVDFASRSPLLTSVYRALPDMPLCDLLPAYNYKQGASNVNKTK